MTDKKQLNDSSKVPEDDFDNWDDWGGMDDFNIEGEGDRREPADPFKGTVKKVLKDHATDPEVLRGYVGKVLPKQYGTLFDDYTSAKDHIEDAVSDIKKNVKQPLNELANALEKKVPDRFKRTKKWLSKLKDATAADDFYYRSDDAEEQRNKTINLEIQNLFEQMQEENVAIKEEDRQLEKDRFVKNYAKLHSQENLLGIVAKSSDYHRTYLQNLEIPYRKKSLELQYRTVHALQDILKLQTQVRKENIEMLEKIRVNTGLPEIQKLRLGEHYKQDIRNKFVQGSLGFAKKIGGFGDKGSILNSIINNYKNNAKLVGAAVATPLGLAKDLVSGDEDFMYMDEDENEKKINAYSKWVEFLFKDKFMDIVSGGVNKLKKTKTGAKVDERLRRTARDLDYYRNNILSVMDEKASDFERLNSENSGIKAGAYKTLAALIRMGLPTGGLSLKMGSMTPAQLREASQFDHYSRRSLTEVIPGYLSRILQEQQIQRTGDTSIRPLVFNYQLGTFETSRKTFERVNKRLIGSVRDGGFRDALLEPIRKSVYGLTPEKQEAFLKTMGQARKQNKVITPRTLVTEDFYKNTPAAKFAKEFAAAMQRYLQDGNENDKQQSFFQALSDFDAQDENVLDYIQQLIETGNTDMLVEQGWIDPEKETINVDRVVNGLMGYQDQYEEGQLSKGKGRLRKYRKTQKTILDYNGFKQPKAQFSARLEQQKEAIDYRKQHISLLTQIKSTISSFYDRAHSDSSALLNEIRAVGEKTQVNVKLFRMKGFMEMNMGQLNPMNWNIPQSFEALVESVKKNAQGMYEVMTPMGLKVYEKMPTKEEMKALWIQIKNQYGELGSLDSLKNAADAYFRKNASWVYKAGDMIASGAKGVKNLGLKAGRGLWRGLVGTKDKSKDLFDYLKTTSLFGARGYEDFKKEGLPVVGDVYLRGSSVPVITRIMFDQAKLRDSKGNIIRDLVSLVDSEGNIFDELGNVLLTRQQLIHTYVKSDGKLFVETWVARVKAGLRKASDFAKGIKDVLVSGITRSFNISKVALKFAMDVVIPPKDLYIPGEDAPRLTAFKMSQGLYFNEDGSRIFRPTDIKGSVMDENGNFVYNTKVDRHTLVDVQGKPIESLGVMIAGKIRNNYQESKRMIKNAFNWTKNVVHSGAKNTKNLILYGVKGTLERGAVPSPSGYDIDEKLEPTSQTNILLYQIREILNQRLHTSGYTTVSKSDRSDDTPNPNEPQDLQDENIPSTSHDTLGKAFDLAKKGVSGAADLAGGLLSRGRGKLGRFGQRLKDAYGSRIRDTDESTRDEDLQDIEHIKQSQTQSTKNLLRRFLGSRKSKKPKEKITKGRDGQTLREGSAEERKANWVNINEPNGNHEVAKPESWIRKNTIDVMLDMAGKIASGFKDAIGSGLDFLGDGPDRKGKSGRGRGGWFKRSASKAGKTKPGFGSRIWNKVRGWGGKATAGVGGAASRTSKFANFLVKTASGLKTAGSFVGSKLLTAARFAGPKIGGLFGGPIGWALTAYSVYQGVEYFRNKSKAKNKDLYLTRMSEYGAPYADTATHMLFSQIEQVAQSACSFKDGQVSLDRSKVDFKEIAKITNLAGNNDQIPYFLEWFDKRFTPVFTKWMTAANALSKGDLNGLDELDVLGRIKVLEATANEEGWDVTVNPLGYRELEITNEALRTGRKALIEKLHKEYKDKNAKGIKDQADLTPEQAKKRFNQEMMDSFKKESWTRNGRLYMMGPSDQVAKAHENMMEHKKNIHVSHFRSRGVHVLFDGTLKPLQSLRLRLYGWRKPTQSTIQTILKLEDIVKSYTQTQPDGKASFHGDISEVFKKASYLFGISSNDSKQEILFTNWMNNRFIPVYTTFLGSCVFLAGTDDDKTIEQSVAGSKIYEIAKQLLSTNVMDKAVVPHLGFIPNMDPSTTDEIMRVLRIRAEKEQVQEDYKKTLQTQETQQQQHQVPQKHSDLNTTPTKTQMVEQLNQQTPVQQSSGMVKVSTQSSSYRSIPAYDAVETRSESEVEPSTVSVSSIPEGTKDVSSQMPSAAIPAAAGELKDGTSGMQFIKTNKSRNHIEGLHPMVKKLFLGMVQEYGEITGKKIQVNRGFVTFQEQAEEKRRNPRKAASPGHSLHEFGMAIDINTVDANALEKLGLMKKYGFTRPIGGETWHIEPSGIQHDPHGLKKKPQEATSAIASSPGTGGGGIGQTKNAARLGSRNTQAALKTRSASGNKVQPEQIAKESTSVHGKGGFAAQIKDQVKNNSILTEAKGDAKSLYSSLSVQGKDKDAMKALVDQAAAGVGVHPDAAKATVAVESGFRSAVGNSKSSAQGLYQFTSKTWDGMMDKYAKAYGIPIGTSPRDPKANAIMGALFMKENLQLAQKRNQGSTMQTAYLYHFAGAPDANKILSAADNAILANVVPSAARSNKEMFYKKDGTPRTKQEFMEYVNRKIRNAANGFGIDTAFMDDGQEPTVMKAATQVVQPPTRREPSPVVSPREDFGRAVMTQSIPAPSRVTPVVSHAEQEVSRILRDNNKILTDQLSVQKEIKQAVDAVKASIEQTLVEAIGKIQTNPPTTTTPEAPRSRRALEEVTKPAYRTT